MIYFDNAATTFPKPEEVYIAVMQAMKNCGANPGRGGYAMALDAARIVYKTRGLVADFIGAEHTEDVIFTANATEALNLALKGLDLFGAHVITTSMEHNAVYRPLMELTKSGVKITIVQADKEGNITAEQIKKGITKDTKLIITTHASNVSGTIMPIKEIAALAKENNILYAVDAAQSIGYLPINVENDGIDLLAFPGHKGLYGPLGTGCLYIKKGLKLKTLKEGGTGVSSHNAEMPDSLPERYEAGSLNVPGISGLGAGVNYVMEKGLEEIQKLGQKLTNRLIDGLKFIKGITIHGPLTEKRVPVVSFTMNNIDCAEAALILDKKYGIAVRAGLHCAPLAHKSLGTLETGTIRVSFGTFNTENEVDTLLRAVEEMANQ